MSLNRLGPYRISGKLGRGGMGIVYAAVHEETGEKVAIKIITSSLSQESHYRNRFQCEIESLCKLNHPHIVKLFGYGEQEGALYYAMELVEGSNLQEEISKGRRYSWRDALQIGLAISDALQHAHDHGIIHRDLKPANLLINAEEEVKLTDFGIAKLFGATGMTAEGSLLGTADYMSPEQVEGKGVSHRSDLYSLGCLLYVLLAGRPPFSATSLAEIVHQLKFNDPEPISELAIDIPQEFQSVIMRLLHKEPLKRIATARAVNHRLREIHHAYCIDSESGSPSSDSIAEEIQGEQASSNTSKFHSPVDTISIDNSAKPSSSERAFSIATETNEEEGSSPLASEDHFVPLKRESASPSASRSEQNRKWPLWLQASIPLLILCLLGLLTTWMMRPPSADSLYRNIMARTDTDNQQEMHAVHEDIILFMQEYPDDPRRNKIHSLLKQREREQRLEQLEHRVSLEGEDWLPVELAYHEAYHLLKKEPETAAARFAAIIDLYGDTEDASPREALCIQHVKREWAKVKRSIEDRNQSQIIEIQELLERAADLSPSEREEAIRLWQGIIALYGDKPWAEEWVNEAKERLADLQSL